MRTADTKRGNGVIPALAIIVLWLAHLTYALVWAPVPVGAGARNPLVWVQALVHFLVQTYLYTGLFITAHDAMHGSVTQRRKLNKVIGVVSASLFAAFSYRKLHANHMKHHKWPAEDRDPDFYSRSQNFWIWFGVFFVRYATVLQVLFLAGVFNLLKLVLPAPNLIVYWIVPAFAATLQLFYFGTYRPHRYPHTESMGPHRARSQRRNHIWAMLSCYFFGYHEEHHSSPATPWWRLHRLKDRSTASPGQAA